MSEPMSLSQFLSAPAESVTASTAAPVLGMLPLGAAEFSGVRYRIPADYVSRELRGRRMRTVAEVFDEFAAAFNSPTTSGRTRTRSTNVCATSTISWGRRRGTWW